MAGFLILAVGVPHAFDGTGLFVGLGYCIVTCVHLILFMQSDARAGVRRVAPFNLGAALLILAASFTSGTAIYILWVAAFALQCLAPYLIPQHSWVGVARSFHLSPEHYVERHGLLVIIALGKSVVAIGMGAINHIRQVIVQVLDVAQDGQCVIDSLPIPVVQFHLVPSSSGDWPTQEATFGRCATKKQTIYGDRLDLLLTRGGAIVDFELTAANTDEREAARDLLETRHDLLVIGDTGYISAQ
jgi:low temperature requirement A protein (LtrA)